MVQLAIGVVKTFSFEMSNKVPRLQNEMRQTSWKWQVKSEFKMAAGGHLEIQQKNLNSYNYD